MLILYDKSAQSACSDEMMVVMQALLTQAHPPKGADQERRNWNIRKFEISVDKCVVHLEHYDWDTEKTTQHKATFGAEMMNFEDIEDK